MYAIKVLKKNELTEEDDVDIVMTEKRVLLVGIDHPYITRLHTTFQTAVCCQGALTCSTVYFGICFLPG